MMKLKRNNLMILALILGLFSCVNTKVPRKEKKAKKKLSKHLKGVANILNEYPNLSDTFTTVKHDTLIIDSHSVDTSFIMVKDTDAVDKILMEFLSEPDGRELREAERVQRVRYIRNQIIKEVLKDTTFTYSDSLVHSTFIIKDGKFYYKSTVKEQKKAYVTEIVNNIDTDCAIKKDFWQDYKFWLLLILLVIIAILRAKIRK